MESMKIVMRMKIRAGCLLRIHVKMVAQDIARVSEIEHSPWFKPWVIVIPDNLFAVYLNKSE